MGSPTDLTPLPAPAGGRSFTASRRVRWGDADGQGRLRLDGAARYLQDVANDDTRDAGPASSEAWLVRRTVIAVHRPPRVGEIVSHTTFCGGLGARWAERRTTIVGDDGGHLESMALWVRFDPDTGRPTRLDDAFLALYADFTGDRKVGARLRLGPVHAGADRRPWPLRSTDIDGLGHVNNAATWAAVEDELTRRAMRPARAELEHREAIGPDDEVVLASVAEDGAGGLLRLWLMVGDAVRASAVVHPAAGAERTG
jgi:acyl-ACP thioesterase